ncbi:MAG: hypothetical protein QXD13_01715 [Candidatus Pacearchaeota archaeon]
MEDDSAILSKACTQLEMIDLLKKQKELIMRHVSNHQKFRGIPDSEDAKIDFIRNFRWIMREMYCGNICQKNKEKKCEAYLQYLEKNGWRREKSAPLFERAKLIETIGAKKIPMPCQHLNDMLASLTEITEVHIDEHKWYRGIESLEVAVENFLNEYWWVAREMYCSDLCNEKDKCEIYTQYLAQFEDMRKK